MKRGFVPALAIVAPGGADTTASNRERIRARLGVRFAFSDELSATIRGASGNINDPISTNENLTGNFNRKSFNLDWAYLTFTPGQSFGIRPGAIAFTAGKFPNPIFRTDEMVFDEDISAEGLSHAGQPAALGCVGGAGMYLVSDPRSGSVLARWRASLTSAT